MMVRTYVYRISIGGLEVCQGRIELHFEFSVYLVSKKL
ncbi:hypothetical protein Enr17x_45170 [Gimesia fumaroli]|uniref:Uncharacterized protein n=1 Tax=Gimesia fumaroli TaxID=2527976 RepID=A0A518IH86_9PLAN|nr:hypothetical protein Enr17x_45170 [Gimesia fumaroli]